MDGMVTSLDPVRARLATRRGGRSGLPPAMVAAVAVLHVGLVGAVVLLARIAALPPPRAEAGMQVVFAAGPPAAATITDLSAAPVAPAARTEPARLAPVRPVLVTEAAPSSDALPRPVRRAVPRPVARVAGAAPASVPARMPAGREAVASGAPAPAAAPSEGMGRALAGWEADISRAVQAAAIYPEAARLQHREGRAQVQFAYRQGVVAQAEVVRASASAVLDRAALAAVMRARLPPPPAVVGPQTRTMVVWVTFGLSAAD